MASNGKVFVSPGVYTSERDLTFVTQSVGVTTLGIVGETLQGPAFEPIFITNYTEFSTTFGGINYEKFIGTTIPKYEASYIAKSYLSESNQLYVTRVLGLSGYDAGPSWSITTISNPDPTTLTATGTSVVSYINFTGTTSGVTSVIPPASIAGAYYETYTDFNGDTDTISNQVSSLILNEIQYRATNNSTSGTTALFFGSVSSTTFNSVTGATPNPIGVTAYTEGYGVSTIIANSTTDFTDPLNDPWFYSNQFSYYQDANNVGHYNAYGFGLVLSGSVSSLGSGVYSGKLAVYNTNYASDVYNSYDDVVVATLRSRGLATYISDNGPVYKVSATTNVTLVQSESSGMTNNLYSTFKISGLTTDDNTTFTFNASMDYTSTNFIGKVFGIANFSDGKDMDTFPLFVEESYPAFLQVAYYENKIRGLNSTLVGLPGLRKSPNVGSVANYLDQYQTPETPYVVSELRGNKVYRLFKIILISDGTRANTQVKFSIRNVSFGSGTFDLVVRDYYDTDANVQILESFTCSMDPTQNNYIANRVGTSNGEYTLKSKYIMLEMSDEAPKDALPCGFEGYTQRVYGSSKPPFINYKSLYYGPNQVMYNPPNGSVGGGDNTIKSSASGERLNKNYLGISDQTGFDTDFFQYKGKQAPVGTLDQPGTEWSWRTQGFHMDSGATVVLIGGNFTTSGDSAFQVGDASFQSDPTNNDNPYFKLASRKFTFYPYGGFDGWDIYTQSRRNTDRFTLGASGWLKGSRQSATYPTATGSGLFKLITGPNQEVWGNTDFYAYLWGQKTFANPEAVDINIFVTPGIDYVNNSNLVEEGIEMIENERADSIYICTTPDYNLFVSGSYSDDNLFYPDAAVDNLDTAGIDSNYTATYYPWVLTVDTENNTQLFLPATAEVCRNLALTDKLFKPWFASAGYTRGIVKNSIKARKTLTQDDRDVLYKGRINPIATFTDVGQVIWGNKTLQVKESALDRINVRRLLLRARKLISAVAVRLLFEQNDQKVRQDFLDSVNPILDEIRRDRGLIDFRVTVSNTPEDLDSNTLVGKIYLKPTRALEYIDIEFVITPTGASFDDV